MGRLHKGNPLLSYVSMYMLLMIVLTELCHISAASQMDKTDISRHTRRKRQAADFILMGYKARSAIKGTTKPTEFFRRIGKKWAGAQRQNDNDMFLRPNGFVGRSFPTEDENVRDW